MPCGVSFTVVRPVLSRHKRNRRSMLNGERHSTTEQRRAHSYPFSFAQRFYWRHQVEIPGYHWKAAPRPRIVSAGGALYP